jgi:hypothetical protein
MVLFFPGRVLEALAEDFSRRRGWRNYGSNMRKRRRACHEAIDQRFELVEGTSPRGIKPPNCTSPELVFSCCGSVAVLPALANCDEHVARTLTSRPHPPTRSALCTAPAACEIGVVKPLHSPVRDHGSAPPAFLFSVPDFSA